MITALASGSLFSRSATSSNAAFALLSTCAEFFLKSISFSFEASGALAGCSTLTLALPVDVRLRSSVQVADTDTGPGCSPAVSSVPALPLPVTLPADATQFEMLTAWLSGLEHEQLMLEELPATTVAGFAEHEICGGFFGRSLTVKLAEHEAMPFLPSETCAVAV